MRTSSPNTAKLPLSKLPESTVFNPQPRIQPIRIDADRHCYLVDDALTDPHSWVDYAVQYREHFQPSPHSAYPGPEMPIHEQIATHLETFFNIHMRRLLGARRVQQMSSKMAMVTTPPDQLEPRQWICHRDRADLPPEYRLAASVLYLFDNPAFGGTNFYRTRRSTAETDRLVHDTGELSAAEFASQYAVEPGYLSQSNRWFKQVYSVEPKFNRMVFYDGNLFHSSDILDPAALSSDPANGRLTMNGFFTCTRAAS